VVGLSPGDIVLDGDPAPPHGRGTAASHFLTHVYCDQMVTHLSNCWALVLFANASASEYYHHIWKNPQKASAFYTFYNPHICRSAFYRWDMIETYKIISGKYESEITPTLAMSIHILQEATICDFISLVLKVICNDFHKIDLKVVSSCLLQYKPVCVTNFDKLHRKVLKRRSL